MPTVVTWADLLAVLSLRYACSMIASLVFNKVITSGEAIATLTITVASWTVDFLLVVHRFQVSLHVSLATEASALPTRADAIFVRTVLWFSGFPVRLLVSAGSMGVWRGRLPTARQLTNEVC